MLDTLSIAMLNMTSNIKKTVYNILQEHVNEYTFYVPMSLKIFFTYYTQHSL